MDRVGELAESMRALGSACMTWWVSATVLCVTILGASWIYRDELRKAGRAPLHALFTLVGVFFATMVVFGIQAVLTINGMKEIFSDACASAGAARCLPSDATAVSGGGSELIVTGTTSFGIFFIAWVVAWFAIAREPKSPTP